MVEKLLSITEVARYLDIPEDEVKKLVDKGDLPAYKIGGVLLRFKQEQIEAYRRRRDSDMMAEKALSRDRGIKRNSGLADIDERRLRADAGKPPSKTGITAYTAWEKLEDFLYYNDFYILSLILLALIVLAVFKF